MDLPPPPPARPPSAEGEPQADELATIGQRFVARLLDGLALAAVLVPLLLMVGLGDDIDDDFVIPLWVDIVLLGLSALYEIVFLTWRGQTLGKIAMRIKVVRENDRRLPTVGQAAIRHLFPTAVAVLPLPFISVLALVIYLAATWDPLRRGWHDRAAGTIVVAIR